MHETLISVIIPVYNSESTILNCLDSVINQTFLPNEIIIVDDGSIDNSKEIILKYINNSPVIIHYHYQKNKGSGAARNIGINLANNEWVAFIDADDIWIPSKLERQVSILNQHPNAPFISSNYYINTKSNIGINTSQTEFTSSQEYIYSDYISNATLGLNILTSTVLAKKIFLQKAGLFGKQARGQDSDLWCRIGIIGERIIFDNTPLAIYKTSSPPYNFGCTLILNERIEQINSLYEYSIHRGREKAFFVLLFLYVQDAIKQLLYQKRYKDILILLNNLNFSLPRKYVIETKLRAFSPNVIGYLINYYYKVKNNLKHKK
ncbi:MAG: glycosyltransferase family 2 protein [Sedimentisphaerales bacterium]|nr:glycosyltransferase family 2 protein [Sedimentisphaerales bacterium]